MVTRHATWIPLLCGGCLTAGIPESTPSTGTAETSTGAAEPSAGAAGTTTGDAPTESGDASTTTSGAPSISDSTATGSTSGDTSTTMDGGICGDGVVQTGEACDDANTDSRDGCLSNCSIPENCQQIHLMDPGAGDDVYTLTVGDTTWDAYCLMTINTGGWTLAMKVPPGDADAWDYDDAIWTSTDLLNEQEPDLDNIPAKLETWNRIALDAILLAMEMPYVEGSEPTGYLTIEVSADSLHELFAAGAHIETSEGNALWRSAFTSYALQPYDCLPGSINVHGAPDAARVRLGILADNVPECIGPDSALGVGLGGFTQWYCGQDPQSTVPTNSVGAINCEAMGNTFEPGMAWIFVR